MVVLFVDECHLLEEDLCGYVWGASSERIEIGMKNPKNRQTYYGALNYLTGEFTSEAYSTGNGESTVEFVKLLQKKYEASQIVLIWDGVSYHRFGEFRQFLGQVNDGLEKSEWRINCILFAPNDPTQNPVEDVWLQGKNFLRRYWYLCSCFGVVKFLFKFFTNGQVFDFSKKIHQYAPIATSLAELIPVEHPIIRRTTSC